MSGAPAWHDRPAGSVLVHLKGDPVLQRTLLDRLARAGPLTAQGYSYARFRNAWHEQFQDLLKPGDKPRVASPIIRFMQK